MIEHCSRFEQADPPHMVSIERNGKTYYLHRGLGTYTFYDGTKITFGLTATFLASPTAAFDESKETK